MLAAGFLAENAPVRQRAVALKVVHAYVALLAVIHVKLAAVRRECQPIGLRQFSAQQADVAGAIKTKYTLKGKLLLLSRRQVERGIGEIQRAVRTEDDIVRTVEFLSLVAVGKNRDFAFGTYPDDCSQYAGAIDQMMLLIVCAAIRVTERDDLSFLTIERDLVDLVLYLVTEVQKSRWIPYRTLGKSKILGDQDEPSFPADELPELRRLRLQAELPMRRLRLPGKRVPSTQNQPTDNIGKSPHDASLLLRGALHRIAGDAHEVPDDIVKLGRSEPLRSRRA